MATDAATPAVRAALEAERTILRGQLDELGVSKGVGSFDANFADSSQVTAERGETEALAASLVESLRATEHALSKLADGSYGICERCGQEIAPARLEAMPEARLCITCAAKPR
jgi:RNA polymerase-binding transcription factor DksA